MAWSRSCAKCNSSRSPLHDADDDVADVRAAQSGSQQRAGRIERIVRSMFREVIRGIASPITNRIPRQRVDDTTGRVAVPIAAVRAGGEERDAHPSLSFGAKRIRCGERELLTAAATLRLASAEPHGRLAA